MKANHTSQTEGSLLEEPNFKVGRYSAEERKERISKYRAKRSQRNFNKTIKVKGEKKKMKYSIPIVPIIEGKCFFKLRCMDIE